MAKKLLITKTDTLEEVIDLIEHSQEKEVTLVVPRGSKLRDVEYAFSQIRQAAAALAITVTVESIDEELLALAHAEHLETAHPFFQSDRRSAEVSDIVRPVRQEEPEARHVRVHVEDAVAAEPVEEPKPEVRRREEDELEAYGRELRATERRREPVVSDEPRRHPWRKRIALLVLLVVALVAIGSLVVTVFFARASVTFQLEEKPFVYDGTFTAATAVTSPNGDTASVPGQIFVQQKNIAQPFPATGSADGKVAASARIRITNENDTAQPLVVKTRFQTTDGKIFRITSGTTVPAATGTGDSKKPGTVEVAAAPDPGAEDVKPSSDKMTLPGLKGTPRFETVYGALIENSKESQAAGAKIATDDDVKSAQQQLNELLVQSFKTSLIASQPKDLTVIDGAVAVTTSDVTVDRKADESGNFNVLGDAKMQALAFREADVLKLVEQKANEGTSYEFPLTFRTVNVTYSNVQADLENGKVQFSVHVEGVLVPAITEDAVKDKVRGKKVAELQGWISSIPFVKQSSMTISPFWGRTLPEDPSVISVEIR